MATDYFRVGIIANTHGLRGEVKVLPKTDFPDKRFSPGSHLFVQESGKTPFREVSVRSARQHQQFWLVAFEGALSISDVENLKGMELSIHKSQLQPLPEGSYYIHDLIGLRVETEDGTYAGELVDVMTPGANDVYVVRGPLQKRDLLLPAIPDCVLSVDLKFNKMVVHLLPGLLESDSDDETGLD